MRSRKLSTGRTTIAAVGMGTNLGDRVSNLLEARAALAALPDCRGFRFSRLYETEAVDCREPYPFLNAAVSFETALPPRPLLARLHALEDEAGRRRPYLNAPRPLDLDLLLYGDLVIESRDLVLPHPRLERRLFVLAPLLDCLDPDWRHPVSGVSIQRLHAVRHQMEGETVRPRRHPQWASAT